jgi:ABC-type uncharacterized transport system substrate-binding protein
LLSRDPVALVERMLPQPTARRIAVMLNPEDPIAIPQVKKAERAAPSIGVEVRCAASGSVSAIGFGGLVAPLVGEVKDMEVADGS